MISSRGRNLRLLDKVHQPLERLWYAEQAILILRGSANANGWSRAVLEYQIEDGNSGKIVAITSGRLRQRY